MVRVVAQMTMVAWAPRMYAGTATATRVPTSRRRQVMRRWERAIQLYWRCEQRAGRFSVGVVSADGAAAQAGAAA
jgi:hypothetical protein